MAYGWKLGGEWGKMALTLFRLLAVIFGTFYLAYIIRKKYHIGFIICATLIYAGAIGNLIDSLFYGSSCLRTVIPMCKILPGRSTSKASPVVTQVFCMAKWLICFISRSLRMPNSPAGFRFGAVNLLNSSGRFSILQMHLFLLAS